MMDASTYEILASRLYVRLLLETRDHYRAARNPEVASRGKKLVEEFAKYMTGTLHEQYLHFIDLTFLLPLANLSSENRLEEILKYKKVFNSKRSRK
jgi:hypothetical protein